jgi:glycosyltransferase involved in cell wall biosynthesis
MHLANAGLTAKAMRDIVKIPKHDIVHIHLAERGSFVREGALVMLARATGKVTVVTLHGADFLPFASRYPLLVSRVLRSAHLITCLDPEVLSLVGESAPSSLSALVPNPVPIDRIAPKAEKTGPIVLFAGEISHRKGADVLQRAWNTVAEATADAKCIMIGPSSDVVIPTMDRLEVRPPVDANSMMELLRTARVVALPSRAEAMPMVLTEAMASGRPFVSTPVGGIPSLAQHGGVLVPVGDDVALAKRLLEFLSDPRLATEVGEEGRQFCIATRSVEVVDAKLRELYAEASLLAHDRLNVS